MIDTGAVYACAYCGRAAPALNDRALLDWEGGEALYLSEDPQLPPESLVCPDCRVEARERDSVEAD